MISLRLGPAEIRFTGRSDGDFSQHAKDRDERLRTLSARTWLTPKQVHGSRAVAVDIDTAAIGDADAIVTTDPAVALMIKTADCAPIVLVGDGAVGVVHAGWRGLVAGVVAEGVQAMADLGSRPTTAALGPCLRVGCYEFGDPEIDAVAAAFGPAVRGTTAWGTPALDVPAVVRAALVACDVELVHDTGACTACEPSMWWSHRARTEPERQATAAWLR